jgi:hypothetical protein
LPDRIVSLVSAAVLHVRHGGTAFAAHRPGELVMTISGPERWAAVVLTVASLGLGGCAPVRVSAHVDPRADFSHFETFDWGPADALPAGDPRLDANGFFQDHMQGAVERQMLLKGYARAAEGTDPDVRIHFHAVIRERMDVGAVDTQRGFCSGSDCNAGVNHFEEGTLLVDVMDGRTNQLVWRGWAQNSVGDALENQDALAKQIDQAVKGLMNALPGRR